jgi:hypothetical protein
LKKEIGFPFSLSRKHVTLRVGTAILDHKMELCVEDGRAKNYLLLCVRKETLL